MKISLLDKLLINLEEGYKVDMVNEDEIVNKKFIVDND
jgi:hypothetical protein